MRKLFQKWDTAGTKAGTLWKSCHKMSCFVANRDCFHDWNFPSVIWRRGEVLMEGLLSPKAGHPLGRPEFQPRHFVGKLVDSRFV